MRKLWTFLLVLALIGSALTARAGVRFITDVPQNTIQGKLPTAKGTAAAAFRPVTRKPEVPAATR